MSTTVRPALALLAALGSWQCQGAVHKIGDDGTAAAERGRAESGARPKDGAPRADAGARVDAAICTPEEAQLDGHCYRAIGVGSMTYEAGKSSCTALGAQPVSIHSAAENQLVFDLLYMWTECGWIGLRRSDGSFGWEDGSALDYTNWRSGQPGSGTCGCLQGPAAAAAVRGQWKAVSCTAQSREIVCRRKP